MTEIKPPLATPSAEDFGPDAAKTPVDPPDINKKNPPRKASDLLGKLGQNKKARSPVRKLTDDDRDKIESLYVLAGGVLMPFKMSTAQAFANCATPCATAWMELADKNDAVRRAILAFLEGGVWAKVFAAHAPILLTLLPQNASLANLWNMMPAQESEDE